MDGRVTALTVDLLRKEMLLKQNSLCPMFFKSTACKDGCQKTFAYIVLLLTILLVPSALLLRITELYIL